MSLQQIARTFRHGVHPDDHKGTAPIPIERMPFVERYVIPLAQHIGAPARPAVAVGERVTRGQVIGDAPAFVSTFMHSPVTGRVVAVAQRRHPNGLLVESIEIEADPYATQRLREGPVVDDVAALAADDFVEHVKRAGLVGLGGAAFPSHVKYKVPEGKTIRWLVLNGCECEPYLTADHRVMVERPEAVVRGIEILAGKLGVEGAKIGVELNKLDAIEGLRHAARGRPIDVVPLRVKYPQGAEKMLVKAIFGQEVPAGKLPLDLGLVVNNVGTMAALADYFDRGQPLIERVVTVAGTAISRPANLVVPLGTPVREVLRHCGLLPETRQVIMGGPMMGQPLSSLDVPVIKGTSGLLAFSEQEIDLSPEYTCVKCGRCLESCANFLNPSRLARLARAGRYEELEAHYVQDCMECGACTYSCPSGVPIVQLVRVAKAVIRSRKSS